MQDGDCIGLKLFHGAIFMKLGATLGFLLCIGLFLAAPAHSQTAADLKIIRDCLKIAEEKKTYGDNCVGLVADPCMKSAFENNDYDKALDLAKQCARREYLVWSEVLKDAVKKVRAGGFAEITNRVVRGQKNRPAIVEDTCVHFGNIRPEYSVGGADYCRLRETAFHALTLDWLGQALTTPP